MIFVSFGLMLIFYFLHAIILKLDIQMIARHSLEESPSIIEQRCQLTTGGSDPKASATENKQHKFICAIGGIVV